MMWCDDRRGTVTQVERLLLAQEMTNPLALEAIYGKRAEIMEMRLRDNKDEKEKERNSFFCWLTRTHTRCNGRNAHTSTDARSRSAGRRRLYPRPSSGRDRAEPSVTEPCRMCVVRPDLASSEDEKRR